MLKFISGCLVGLLLGALAGFWYGQTNLKDSTGQFSGTELSVASFFDVANKYYEAGPMNHFSDSEIGISFDYPAKLGTVTVQKIRSSSVSQESYPDQVKYNEYLIGFKTEAGDYTALGTVVGSEFTYPREASAAEAVIDYCRRKDCVSFKLESGVIAQYAGQFSLYDSPVSGLAIKIKKDADFTIIPNISNDSYYYIDDILNTLTLTE